MFSEQRDVKQERSGGRRRWFEGDGLELIVWLDHAAVMEGFQLCYPWVDGERALTWRPATGFQHARVDAGDASPLKNETPILVPHGDVPWAEVEARFRRQSASLEPALRELIGQRLARRA